MKGRPYVLYLYPRDDTPGCTKEAQGFTEHKAAFAALGVPVIGLSKDDVATTTSSRRSTTSISCSPPTRAARWSRARRTGREEQLRQDLYGHRPLHFLVDGDGRIARAARGQGAGPCRGSAGRHPRYSAAEPGTRP
ncbi:MAG: redoxin domain-containing protein [Geminicoccaceae bacterium]